MKKILFVLPILAMFVLGGCGYQMSETEVYDDDHDQAVIELEDSNYSGYEDQEDDEDHDLITFDGELRTVDAAHGLALDIPMDWEVVLVDGDEIQIRTDQEPYEVIEYLEITPVDTTPADGIAGETEFGVVHLLACGGAYGCYFVEVDKQMYKFIWSDRTSTEPTPEDLDGIWSPSVSYDRDTVIFITSTLRLSENQMYESGLINAELPAGFVVETADAGGASAVIFKDDIGEQEVALSFFYEHSSETDWPNLTYDSWVDGEWHEVGDAPLTLDGYLFDEAIFPETSEKYEIYTDSLVYVSKISSGDFNYAVVLLMGPTITEQMQGILDSIEFFPGE